MTNKGLLINSKNGTKVEVKIVKGSGKGADKEFINLIFSAKPSETVRNAMKLNHFKYYSVDGTWSAFKTEKTLDFAYSLIKDNKTAEKPKSTARGSSKKSSKKAVTIEDRVTSLEQKFEETNDLLRQLIEKMQ